MPQHRSITSTGSIDPLGWLLLKVRKCSPDSGEVPPPFFSDEATLDRIGHRETHTPNCKPKAFRQGAVQLGRL